MDPPTSNGFQGIAAARPAFGCVEVQKRLWEYLDEELSENDAQRTGWHLAGCRECGGHAAWGRRLLDRIAAVRPEYGALTPMRNRISSVLAALGDR